MVSTKQYHVLKIDCTKFMACPVSTITRRTWQILRLVNEVCGAENCEILHLPFNNSDGGPGTILDQPTWFRDAVAIVRCERYRHRKEELEKMK